MKKKIPMVFAYRDSDSLVSDGWCTQNTSSHAHVSQSCQSSKFSARILKKTSPSSRHVTLGCSTCFIILFDTSTDLETGIRSTQSATPRLGGQSGHLADPIQSTGYEPKTCIGVSSEHTPINFPTGRDSFNLENDLKFAVSEDSDHLPQRVHDPAMGVQRESTIRLQVHFQAPGIWRKATNLLQVLKGLC